MQDHHPRSRFWVELALAISSLLLGVVTLVWHDWVEVVTGADPDHGNGSFEAVVTLALMTVAVLFAVAGSVEWRRTLRLARRHRATS